MIRARRIATLWIAALGGAAASLSSAGEDPESLTELFRTAVESTGADYVHARDAFLASEGATAYVQKRLRESGDIPARLHAEILRGWMENRELYSAYASVERKVPPPLGRMAPRPDVYRSLLASALDKLMARYDTAEGRPLLYERLLKFPLAKANLADFIGEDGVMDWGERDRYESWMASARAGHVRVTVVRRVARAELAEDSLLSHVLGKIAVRKGDCARIEAIRALATRGTKEAVPILLGILADVTEEESVRTEVIAALSALTGTPEPVAPAAEKPEPATEAAAEPEKVEPERTDWLPWLLLAVGLVAGTAFGSAATWLLMGRRE